MYVKDKELILMKSESIHYFKNILLKSKKRFLKFMMAQ